MMSNLFVLKKQGESYLVNNSVIESITYRKAYQTPPSKWACFFNKWEKLVLPSRPEISLQIAGQDPGRAEEILIYP